MRQHFVDAVFQLPQVVVIQLFLNLRQFVEIFLARVVHHQARNIVIAFQVFRLFFNAFGNEIINATLNVTRRILLQTSYNQILLINNATVIQPLFTVEDLH